MKNKSTVFIGVMIVISALLFGIFFMMKPKGDRVIVTVNGEEVGNYSLSENQTVRIDLEDGEYNIFTIKDGEVDMIESTCENQICVFDYPISKDFPGVIVCLPHELIVEIKQG